MRLLVVLLVTQLSSSSCVAGLAFALSPVGAAQRAKEGRIRAAAYRRQLELDGAAARRSYNANVRGPMEDTLTRPPLVETEPERLTPPPLVTSPEPHPVVKATGRIPLGTASEQR